MRNRGISLLIVISVACIGSLGLVGGCSESKERQDGRKLLEEVTRSRKLYHRALGLLANPVYRIGDDYSPVQKALPPSAIETVLIPPADQIHPQILPTLNKAENILTSALRDCPEAAEMDQSVAQIMHARIISLRGYCIAFAIDHAILDIRLLRERVRAKVTSASSRVDLLAYYQELGASGDQDIRQLLDRSNGQKSQTVATLQQIDDRLSALKNQKLSQENAYGKYNALASALGKEGRDTPGQPGLAKVEEALSIQGKANAAERKVAEIEHETNTLNAHRKILEFELTAIELRIKALKDVVKAQKIRTDKYAAAIRNVREGFKNYEQEIGKLLVEIDRASQEIASALSESSNVYDLALRALKTADRSASPGAGTAGLQADLLIATADMKARSLVVVSENKALASQVKALWSKMLLGEVPVELAKIQSFLPSPDLIRNDTEATYSEAAKLYARALQSARREVDSKYHWAYQGQLAIAYIRLYAFSQDPAVRSEALTSARAAVKDALRGKEFSPHLAAIKNISENLLPPEEE